MEHTKCLYLIHEFDRRYKQLQHPARFVAKAHSAIRLNDMLRVRDVNLDEHEKLRRYVAVLHRYLNVNAPSAHPRSSVGVTMSTTRLESSQCIT